tara:strand:- start:926 stop:1132 length:207 start_codon:yes stop_codon:yes gene_type:complete
MRKKASELKFISWIKRDGSGTEQVPKSMLKMMLENDITKNNEFEINSLSLSNNTYIASGFNSFVVKLK